jgi:hypothetical protein
MPGRCSSPTRRWAPPGKPNRPGPLSRSFASSGSKSSRTSSKLDLAPGFSPPASGRFGFARVRRRTRRSAARRLPSSSSCQKTSVWLSKRDERQVLLEDEAVALELEVEDRVLEQRKIALELVEVDHAVLDVDAQLVRRDAPLDDRHLGVDRDVDVHVTLQLIEEPEVEPRAGAGLALRRSARGEGRARRRARRSWRARTRPRLRRTRLLGGARARRRAPSWSP